MTLTLVAIGAGGVLLLGIIVILGAPPVITGIVSSALILSAHSAYVAGGLGTVTRIAGLGLLVAFAILNSQNNERSRLFALRIVTVCGVVIYAITYLASPSMSGAFGAGVAFLGSTALLHYLLRTEKFNRLAIAWVYTLFAGIAISLALYVVTPDEVTRGSEERLRGIFFNANTLGFFCALVLVAILVGNIVAYRYIIGAVCLVALFLSGSRSSVLGVAVAATIVGLYYVVRGRALFVFFVGTVVCAVSAVVLWLSGTAATVFRTNNSRGTGNDYVLQELDLAFIGGVGYGGEVVEIASTPLRWLAQGGILVFAIVIIGYFLVLIASFKLGLGSVALSAFGITTSMFEGWYFAGASGLFITYWLVFGMTAPRPAVGDLGTGSEGLRPSEVRLESGAPKRSG